MEYTRLGKTGLKVSRVCLGAMSFGDPKWMGEGGAWVRNEEESLNMIRLAWEAGINFIDTANIYSNGVSEQIVGKAIKKFNIPRSRVVVATKCFFPMFEGPEQENMMTVPPTDPRLINNMGLSRKHIMDAVDSSLKRLDMDYIDILYIHRFDPNTPIEETMEALHDLVKAGKVRYLGASSMHAWQFVRMNAVAEKNGWTQFVVMQNYYNALYREEEREMMPYLKDQGIGMAPWSPLAQGLLARDIGEKTPRTEHDFILNFLFGGGFSDADKAIMNRVGELATKRGVSRSQIATAWVLAKDVVSSPILGLGKEQYLRDAVAAVKLKLTDEEIKFIDEPYQPKKVVGHQV
ncbi:voltage-gated shaker-like K+ channel, subunit [Gongronella butleri]|nr:voltage-gated shaker-like K+ channel, subunit [Gongronella butleri]